MNEAKPDKKQPLTRYWFYDFVKLTAAPGFLWFRPKLLYANDRARQRIRGGALMIANHIGFFDPVYLHFAVWYRRLHFVCLKDFFESGWAWFFRAVQCIPIDKENVGLDSVREIIRHLRDGELVCLFPEGGVNKNGGELASFKSGMVLMAMRSGKPIIPVYIRPKRHWYDRLVMAIGEAVDVKKLCGERSGVSGLEAAAELLHEREEELKDLTGRVKR